MGEKYGKEAFKQRNFVFDMQTKTDANVKQVKQFRQNQISSDSTD